MAEQGESEPDSEQNDIDWETCVNDGCIGIRLAAAQGGDSTVLYTKDRCLAHASMYDLEAALQQLGQDGIVDARGVTFTAELLELVLAGAPRDDKGHLVLNHAWFDYATFQGDAEFSFATFQEPAEFTGATFQSAVSFLGATFCEFASFDNATFQGDAGFTSATFRKVTWFDGSTFRQVAHFNQAAFHFDALFPDVTFQGPATFDNAIFQDSAVFKGASYLHDTSFDGGTFKGDAWFNNATFGGGAEFFRATFESAARFSDTSFLRDASFDRAEFREVAFFSRTDFSRDGSFYRARFRDATFHLAVVHGDVRFTHTVFESAKLLGPMLVERGLVLDNAVFHERVQIEVAAAALCARRARFLAGTRLRVRWADIALDDADLAATSILTGEPSPFSALEEGRWAQVLGRLRRIQGTSSTPGRPRLISLQHADVAGLTVAGVDLRACRFIGAHNLDQLRIQESDHAFPPEGGHRFRRHTIAEEHHWRAHYGGKAIIFGRWRIAWRRRRSRGGDDYYGRAERPPQWLGEVDLPTATQVAAVYRDLRKGREDAKDEPGAAYFYYGEMEMRRHATSRYAHRGGDRPGMPTAGETRHLRNSSLVPLSANRPGMSATGGSTDASSGRVRITRSGRRPGMSPTGETLILSLYWLLSGYGVRARRALVGLAGAILVASVAFAFWGFADPGGPEVRAVDVDDQGAPVYELHDPERSAGLGELPNAIRFSAQSIAALIRGPEPDIPLTPAGEWLHLALRLVGPLLFGLAILAIRSRVKR